MRRLRDPPVRRDPQRLPFDAFQAARQHARLAGIHEPGKAAFELAIEARSGHEPAILRPPAKLRKPLVGFGLVGFTAGVNWSPAGFSRRSPAARQVGAMKKRISGMIALAAALRPCGPGRRGFDAVAARKLMTDGDRTDKVEAYCGAPASIERREILQRRSAGIAAGHTTVRRAAYEVSVEYLDLQLRAATS